MADRLTQLQDCYDQLATQFYASIRYLSLHHTSSALTSPPSSDSRRNNNSSNANANANSNHEQPVPQQELPESSYPPEQRPDTPTTFASAQRELAQDLLLKTKQIEYLISVLPGVENSLDNQGARVTELDGELREALEERKKAEEERERWLAKIDGIIGGIRR
ncbi:mediator complex, subunit Med21 [Usnea florida]